MVKGSRSSSKRRRHRVAGYIHTMVAVGIQRVVNCSAPPRKVQPPRGTGDPRSLFREFTNYVALHTTAVSWLPHRCSRSKRNWYILKFASPPPFWNMQTFRLLLLPRGQTGPTQSTGGPFFGVQFGLERLTRLTVADVVSRYGHQVRLLLGCMLWRRVDRRRRC